MPPTKVTPQASEKSEVTCEFDWVGEGLAKKMLEIMAPSLPKPPTVKTAPRRVVAIRSNSRTTASSTIVDVHVDSCVCIDTLA